MKLLYAILPVWLIPFSSHAEPELNIALKGGPNTATLAQDNRVSRYGFSGGLASDLQWSLADHFSLAGQIELLYTPRGAKAISGGTYLGQVRQHYFDVMVAARPQVRLGPASVYLLLGGGLNLLVSATKENASGETQDITDGLHRTDVALLGAAGVALHLPYRETGLFRLGTLFIEARHDIGLIDTDAVNGGYKNRTSSLMLGLSFVVGGPPSPDPTAGSAK